MLFQLFVSVILTAWAWFATVFLGSYLGFFLFVAPGSTSGAKNLVFPFLTRTKCEPCQMDTIICHYPWLQTLASLSAHIFLYCFCPWPCILNVLAYCRGSADLFWKICRQFGHILITCLKCSRAYLSPSSYSEKIR